MTTTSILITNHPDPPPPPLPDQAVEVAGARIFRRDPTDDVELPATFRAPDGPRADVRACPGGKVEPDETMHEAVRRDVRKELDVELGPGVFVATACDHDPSQIRQQHVRVHGFAFDVTTRPITPTSMRWACWIFGDRFDEHDWPPASRKPFKHFKTWLAQPRASAQPPS